jgi:hypothetical protein
MPDEKYSAEKNRVNIWNILSYMLEGRSHNIVI